MTLHGPADLWLWVRCKWQRAPSTPHRGGVPPDRPTPPIQAGGPGSPLAVFDTNGNP
jgi:hypothetical protein